MNKFIANENDKGQTIFKFLKKNYKTTPLSVIYKWLRTGDVKVNDKRIKDKNYLIAQGDEIIIYDVNKPIKRDNFKKVSNYNLNVIFEDANVLIVNKPFNLEVHSPVNISLDDIVKNYLFDKHEYNPDEQNSYVISHVHRLDKLTSGLIIYAKNKTAHDLLTTALQNKNMIEKFYRCKTDVSVLESKNINGWIEYNPIEKKSIFSLHAQPGFKSAQMIINVMGLDITNQTTEMEVQLLTGRKHQIRATLEYFNMPILNDFRYSGTMVNDQKMIFLFASKLVFKHLENELAYLSGKILEIEPNW